MTDTSSLRLSGNPLDWLEARDIEIAELRDLTRRCHHMILLLTKFEMGFAMGGGEEKLKALMEEMDGLDWMKEERP